MKNRLARIALILCLLLALGGLGSFAYGSNPTDKILDYEIYAQVNEDATVTFIYCIQWEVLESDGIGPMEWVTIGLPNSNYYEVTALTDNITSISEGYNSVDIYFDRQYYKGDVCQFEFAFVQDYLYSVNDRVEGETVYYYTPGWFDDIEVENMFIVWNNENAKSWSSGSYIDDGWNVWQYSLAPGERVSIEMVYDNDAYDFDFNAEYGGGDFYEDPYEWVYVIIGVMIFLFIPLGIFIAVCVAVYKDRSGFSGSTKKITRTKITYYPVCQGCGGTRKDGETNCSYCGRSFIQSEEILKEETISDEDKAALRFKRKGEYHYSSDPNTYVRVNVVHIPSHSRSSGGSSHGGSGRGGGRSGGCAHSSCACASHCACACACACAGGGRAGCTTKDFYNTNLKLKQLELKEKHKD